MSRAVPIFAVKVLVKNNGSQVYSIPIGGWVDDKFQNGRRMYHIPARTPEIAREKAKKYGHPINVRQVDKSLIIDRDRDYIEHLDLQQTPDVIQVTTKVSSAMAMDEMIWAKRNGRRKNSFKDKQKGIDS